MKYPYYVSCTLIILFYSFFKSAGGSQCIIS